MKESRIHGLGLFADQFIAEGATIWRYTPEFDLRFTEQQILSFPIPVQLYLTRYAWKSKKSKLYCFSSDNGKYFNHSAAPNVISEHRPNEEEVVTVALRDIFPGEEITDDYSSFEESDQNVLNRIGSEHFRFDA